MTMKLATKPVPMPSLEERIAELHSELDTMIQEYLATQQTYGVPETIISQLFWAGVAKAQSGRCLCKGAQHIIQATETKPN